MQRWRHTEGWTPQNGKGRYLWWFECLTKTCRTRQVMPPEAYLRPGQKLPAGGAAPADDLLSGEESERLAHFRSI